MKTLQFGIASIVDTNTGYGLPHSNAVIDYTAADSEARQLRSGSFSNYLQRLRSGVSAARYILRKRRELKKSLRQLGALNDHLLADIGFTRADISAAENGQLDRAQLELQRVRNLGSKRILQRNPVKVAENASRENAANEAIFDEASCA